MSHGSYQFRFEIDPVDKHTSARACLTLSGWMSLYSAPLKAVDTSCNSFLAVTSAATLEDASSVIKDAVLLAIISEVFRCAKRHKRVVLRVD